MKFKYFILLFYVFMSSSVIYAKGPCYKHKDPTIQLEFEKVYQDIRNVLTLDGASKCIDYPTFCVDTNSNKVYIGSTATSMSYDSTDYELDISTNVSIKNRLKLKTVSVSTHNVIDIEDYGGSWRWHIQYVDNDGTLRFIPASSNYEALFDSHVEVEDQLRVRFSDIGTHNAIEFKDSGGSWRWHIQYVDNDGSLRFIPASGNFYVLFQSTIAPTTDGGANCGKSGLRWGELWAINGTVQTSVGKYKEDIRNLSEDIEVPHGILYKRTGRTEDQIGFLADNLPLEAFAIKEDGTRSDEDIYTSAVIGILCSAVRKLQEEIENLKER